ncbi:amino acid ABC transporter permease (plasmid) [Bradyrhizobium sp. ISRA435]|nr:amino acid ABC transporter permease [Bradyrhizobium sp. ISRA435]
MTNYWKTLLGSPFRASCTIFVCWIIWTLAGLAFDWLVLDATTSGGPETCKASRGACWPFIVEKIRFMVFGVYPFDQQWRALTAMSIFLAGCCISMMPCFWGRRLLLLIPAVFAAVFILLRGGLLGLPYVPAERWSGLPLTLLLSVATFSTALPLGILLALARCSSIRVVQTVSTALVECIRGIPLISLLFMTSVMSPMLMPGWTANNAFLMAQIPITIFIAGYIAETVRGGLIAIPLTQVEAAASLGLNYWQTTFLVVLPQAITSVIGPLVALFIAFFQDTTLVGMVGLLDFLSTIRSALQDPRWQGIATVEGYLFAGFIYLTFSVGLGIYGRFLERIVGRGRSKVRETEPTMNAISPVPPAVMRSLG